MMKYSACEELGLHLPGVCDRVWDSVRWNWNSRVVASLQGLALVQQLEQEVWVHVLWEAQVLQR